MSDARTSDWAATANWAGLKGMPSAVQGIITANPSQTSVVVPLAKLTGGGTNGSLTIQNGVIVAYKPPT